MVVLDDGDEEGMVVLDDGDEVEAVALAYHDIHNQVEVVAMDDDAKRNARHGKEEKR